jgi:hypothetical protein
VVWFSILSRQALRNASFTSPAQLRQAIDDFVAVYNQKGCAIRVEEGSGVSIRSGAKVL